MEFIYAVCLFGCVLLLLFLSPTSFTCFVCMLMTFVATLLGNLYYVLSENNSIYIHDKKREPSQGILIGRPMQESKYDKEERKATPEISMLDMKPIKKVAVRKDRIERKMDIIESAVNKDDFRHISNDKENYTEDAVLRLCHKLRKDAPHEIKGLVAYKNKINIWCGKNDRKKVQEYLRENSYGMNVSDIIRFVEQEKDHYLQSSSSGSAITNADLFKKFPIGVSKDELIDKAEDMGWMYGTLAGIVKDAQAANIAKFYAVTAFHVIHGPSNFDARCKCFGTIVCEDNHHLQKITCTCFGIFGGSENNTAIDLAVIPVGMVSEPTSPINVFSGEINTIIGKKVICVGATSDACYGTVVLTELSYQIGGYRRDNLLLIKARGRRDRFTRKGDSGSLVIIEDTKEAIAIVTIGDIKLYDDNIFTGAVLLRHGLDEINKLYELNLSLDFVWITGKFRAS